MRKNPIKNIFITFNLIKRVPNATFILLLILIAGIAEGVSISVLVPVLSSLTGEFTEGNLPLPFNILPDGMSMIGIVPSFGSMLIATLLILLSAYCLIYFQERAVVYARFRYLEMIRDRADSAIFLSRWEHLSGMSSGSTANIIINESERGAEGLLSLMSMLAIMIQLIVYGIFAVMLSIEMFMIAFVTVLLATITARRLIRAVRTFGKRSVDVHALYSRQFVEFIRGAKLIKATNIVQDTVESLQKSNVEGCEAKRKIIYSQSLMKFELQVLISVAMVSILYIAVVGLKVQVSILLVFMFIIMRLAPKFTSLQGQYHNYSAFRPSLEIVDEIIRESENKAENIQKHGQKFTDIHHELRLENVTYSYNDGESEALKGLSLVIGSREYVAIIGKSGCGKSTTLDILIGLIKPASGKVTIDGIDLNEIDRSTYLQKIGFVSQESIFFIGTIRENICIGLGDSCDEMYLWECLKMAQIDEFVRSLPNTIETEIGEAGVKLSGGQKQRLAIARALMRRPALLILDEATSALDSDSEVRFQMAIQAVAHNYTIVVVAHRLSTIRNAQRIYVLDGGKLVQQGDYDSLTARRGIFLELVDAQALGVN